MKNQAAQLVCARMSRVIAYMNVYIHCRRVVAVVTAIGFPPDRERSVERDVVGVCDACTATARRDAASLLARSPNE